MTALLERSGLRRAAVRLSGFRRDREGVAAIEFAFIAPVMIVLYFGIAALCTVMMADRRTYHADGAIGDLAAQAVALQDSDVADIWAVSSTILAPFDTSTLQLRLTSISLNASGVPVVDWSNTKSSTQPDLPAYGCGATPAALPSNLLTNPGDNVIMAEAVYSYTSPISYLTKTDFKFSPRYFMRPRQVAKIPRFKNGPGSTTPYCP